MDPKDIKEIKDHHRFDEEERSFGLRDRKGGVSLKAAKRCFESQPRQSLRRCGGGQAKARLQHR